MLILLIVDLSFLLCKAICSMFYILLIASNVYLQRIILIFRFGKADRRKQGRRAKLIHWKLKASCCLSLCFYRLKFSLSWTLFEYKLTNDIANQSTCHLILGNTPEEKDSEELYFPDQRNPEDLWTRNDWNHRIKALLFVTYIYKTPKSI